MLSLSRKQHSGATFLPRSLLRTEWQSRTLWDVHPSVTGTGGKKGLKKVYFMYNTTMFAPLKIPAKSKCEESKNS
jgi:hypothetical protein